MASLKHSVKGVLAVQGAITHNNPPKAVRYDVSEPRSGKRPSKGEFADGIVDANSCHLTSLESSFAS
jgi:hypothetical protein